MPEPPCPPPPSARCPVSATYSCETHAVEPVLPSENDELPLHQIVDISLLNSPKTRQQWYQAKAAAAEVGTARGAYLPSVTFSWRWDRETQSAVNLGMIPVVNQQQIIEYGLQTTYLLFDFGGRNANLQKAVYALSQMNWLYNWEVQTVMIEAIRKYYDYSMAKAIVLADEEAVHDNMVTYEAAHARRTAGVTGLSDELQAETRLIESKIELQRDLATMETAKSTLLQAMGLDADTPLRVAPLPLTFDIDTISNDMRHLICKAKENRADLKATRAHILHQRAEIERARSHMMPKATTHIRGTKTSVEMLRYLDNWTLEFDINAPIFQSFEAINALRKARAELFEAQAVLDDDELRAYLEVLTDYYEFIASSTILKHSNSYVKTAKLNQVVALANYQNGVTTIIDLMVANNALHTARKQLAEAKTKFLSSIANLAYDTGGLTFDNLSANDTVNPGDLQTGVDEVYEDPE